MFTVRDYQLSSSNHLDSVPARPPPGFTPKTDLAELFSKLALGKYTDLFQEHEVGTLTFNPHIILFILSKTKTN